MVRYGYYAESLTWEDTSLLTKEDTSFVTREETSHGTREVSSHRKYIGNNNTGNNVRAREGKKNRFNDFEQHSYDFEELERILTQ